MSLRHSLPAAAYFDTLRKQVKELTLEAKVDLTERMLILPS